MNLFRRTIRPPFVFYALFGTVLFSLLLYLYPTITHRLGIPRRPQQSYDVSSNITARQRLHLLIPVDAQAASTSSTFCKTILSALVHGYEPILLNWDVKTDGDGLFAQRMKVFGMPTMLQKCIERLTEEAR
jgi:hypothetical protein